MCSFIGLSPLKLTIWKEGKDREGILCLGPWLTLLDCPTQLDCVPYKCQRSDILTCTRWRVGRVPWWRQRARRSLPGEGARSCPTSSRCSWRLSRTWWWSLSWRSALGRRFQRAWRTCCCCCGSTCSRHPFSLSPPPQTLFVDNLTACWSLSDRRFRKVIFIVLQVFVSL